MFRKRLLIVPLAAIGALLLDAGRSPTNANAATPFANSTPDDEPKPEDWLVLASDSPAPTPEPAQRRAPRDTVSLEETPFIPLPSALLAGLGTLAMAKVLCRKAY